MSGNPSPVVVACTIALAGVAVVQCMEPAHATASVMVASGETTAPPPVRAESRADNRGTVRPQVLDLMARVRDSLQAQNVGPAKTLLSQARALPDLSPAESRIIAEMETMALYADGDYRGAAAKAQALVASDEKAGFMSGENLIRLWATSCIKQDDTAGYRAALEVMVRYYPSRDYWQDLILRTAREDQLPREFALDVYRLLRSTANLRDARSYTKMAELAIDAGLPGEARSVIDEGYKRGILGVGEDKDVFLQKSLRMNIESQCRHDAEALPNLDRMAGLADTGEPLLSNGLAHVTYGEAEKGLAMMMQGLQKGGLTSPDLAQLHLGFAYYASAHRQHARETFAKVTSAEGPAHLARLWRILVDQPPLPYP